MNGFMKEYFKTNGKLMGWTLLILVGFWVVVLIILPQASMLDFSFRPNLPPPEMGGPKDNYTLGNYQFLIFGAEGNPDGYNKVDLAVFGRTLLAAAIVTIIDLMLCYPIAYYLGQSKGGGILRILVLLLIIPYWINEILRAFAFRIIFGDSGVINEFMMLMGLIDNPIDFIRENVALYAGLSYAYILLMIFPMYNVIESLDRNQIEAARDMGASWVTIHRRIVIPFAKPGIASGCTMVFMLSAGALAAPQILGGPSSLWFTQLIYQWFNQGGNWTQGSAYAVVLLVTCIIIVLSVMRMFKVNMGDIGK
ncbi:Spermidine/putrescine import ABC transporter permease protein PotB (TC 3.A.1.11.1) [hydrothermal vent metagenome]|uniref:Spermidine/putrescine import ABC transporter permease protein PotB (TC 3.A.1.11.1) n=1 Tax=hydrothermal vent metagenome TaxID=652676 RepID=A0A3B0S7M8_9ZZZZ